MKWGNEGTDPSFPYSLERLLRISVISGVDTGDLLVAFGRAGSQSHGQVNS
jgi:hypothetical protein